MARHTVSGLISDETLSKIIQIESKGRPNAKNPRSSATGLAQFLAGTWLEELKQHRPDLFNGKPYNDELALRRDPHLAIELLARFTEDNARLLPKGYGDGDLYLAHFAGVGTARRLLRAPATAPASKYFSAAAMKANPHLRGKDVAWVRNWAHRKMSAAGKVDWVAKYYRPVQPPDVEPVETPELETDTLPPVVPMPPDIEHSEPEVEPKKKSWFRRIGEWFTGAGGFSIFAYLTDPKVVLAIGGFVAAAFLFWWFVMGGRKKWKGIK